MADLTFDTFLDHLDTGFVWTTATIRSMLVNTNTWTPSKSDGFVATILSAGATEVTAAPYARQTVTGKTKTLDGTNHRIQLGINTIDFGAMVAAQNYNRLVLYNFVTSDADSWLVCALDVGALTTNGVDQQFAPNAAGLYVTSSP